MPVALQLENKKFGRWTVLRRDLTPHPTKCRQSRWLCRCECGNEQTIPSQPLVRGESKGCRECRHNRLRKPGGRRAYTYMFCSLKIGAKNRGIEFFIDKEETYQILVQQGFKCALSGRDIKIADTLHGHKNRESTASLDRKDSSLGYVPGNVHWVHKTINFMKSSLPIDEFVTWCKDVASNNEPSGYEIAEQPPQDNATSS